MAFGFIDADASFGVELGSGGLGIDSALRSGVDVSLIGMLVFVFSEGLVKAAGFRMYVFAPVIGKGADDGKCTLILGKVRCELATR